MSQSAPMTPGPAGKDLRLALLLFGVPAALLFAAGWMRASRDTVDDAYITFRCVENFVRGAGLTFNPGTRVEAFSNPLMAFLLVPAAAAGIPLELPAMLIGLVSFAACAWFVYALALKATGSVTDGVLAASGVVANFPLLYYATTGLETGLFAALITGVLWHWVHRGRLDWLGSLLWVGLLLCRPEAPAYLLFFLPLLLWSRENRTAAAFGHLAVIGGVFAAFLVARRMYYGLWLPNPFYAKAAGTADLDPASGPIAGAIDYAVDFCWRLGLLAPLLAGAGVAFGFRERAVRGAAALVAAGFAFAVYTGGDWFPASRYLVPISPVVILLGVFGAWMAAGRVGRASIGWLARGVLLATMLLASGLTLLEFRQYARHYPYHLMNGGDCNEAARWMRDNLPEDTRIVAYRIGALGAVTRFHVIDAFGLADHEIATIIHDTPDYHPGEAMGDSIPELGRYIRSQSPTAVLAHQLTGSTPRPYRDLYGLRFTLVRTFPQGEDQLWVLYRLDPAREEVTAR